MVKRRNICPHAEASLHKKYGLVEVKLHAFLTLKIRRCEWPASCFGSRKRSRYLLEETLAVIIIIIIIIIIKHVS
jgi:hypothetical protein